MLRTKSIEVKKRTISIVFEGDDKEISNLDIYQASSMAILTGFFNPYRSVSNSDSPINLEHLKEYKDTFEELLIKIISNLDINVEKITKLS